ncbi:hypothetical protein [Psychrobacter sp. DAB_AL62B]|uniref:hypothetical protein n=1 Tax=Psychrobacter sp. DAB_AL62B TaxID=1028420 RepID=UPI002380D26F|nr:hypothetical protein [Psychrobacter sp. DAB_AL62B]MDE4454993.1 hypothetical protein [Psychrobacter sp. DAB_AL62B]
MVNLSTFQAFLAADTPLVQTLNNSVSSNEPHLRKWAALLPAQTEIQQAEQIERVLAELRVANIDDRQRFTLTSIVIDAANQLIATLRQYYIYETKAFNVAQLGYVAQVKSLYYLIVMAFNGVIHRETAFLNNKQQQPSSSLWQRYFTSERSSPITLAIAIYQTLLMYQKLLFEDALCYQKPLPYIWSNINQLYHMACEQQASDINLSAYIATHRADTIHQLYCQICLHSLLNVRAMRRPTILLVQRLLPQWAEHIVATIEPRTATRVFVNLHSKEPPTCLTAHSSINPYDAHHACLFIELAPMISYLKSCIEELSDVGRVGVKYCLTNHISMALSYRYIQPKLTLPIKYSAKQNAQVMTGFNDIHYHISKGQSLISLIEAKTLPKHQQPRYDTLPKKQSASKEVAVEIFDRDNALSHFRTLRLLFDSDEPISSEKNQSLLSSAAPIPSVKAGTEKAITTVMVDENDMLVSITPPPLRLMSLFLLCRPDISNSPNWSVGVVRWLTLDTEKPELEWQVLGHKLIACGIRLQDRGARSRHFVPAFVVGGDEHLQTTDSLLLPTSHFQTGDKVTMRINDKQKSLRLIRRLMTTDEFSQYEVVQA